MKAQTTFYYPSLSALHLTITLFASLGAFIGVPMPLFSADSEVTPSTTTTTLDQIVAIVNHDVILQSELNEKANTTINDLVQQGVTPPTTEVLHAQLLEQLIISKLELERANKLGITVDEETVNRMLADIANHNHTSLSELPARLAAEGLDYQEFRQQIRDQLIIEQLRNRDVVSRLDISRQDVIRFLEEQQGNSGKKYKISHLLLALDGGADESAIRREQALADELVQRVKNGEAFAALVIAYSDAPDALNGGDMGWRTLDQIPSIYADTVKGLSPGSVSAPIHSDNGIHIVRLDETQENQTTNEETFNQAYIALRERKLQDEEQNWLRRLRDEAYVEIHLQAN